MCICVHIPCIHILFRKAAELLRLADIRSSSSSLASLGLSASCKSVLCLELAAAALGETTDRVRALEDYEVLLDAVKSCLRGVVMNIVPVATNELCMLRI